MFLRVRRALEFSHSLGQERTFDHAVGAQCYGKDNNYVYGGLLGMSA